MKNKELVVYAIYLDKKTTQEKRNEIVDIIKDIFKEYDNLDVRCLVIPFNKNDIKCIYPLYSNDNTDIKDIIDRFNDCLNVDITEVDNDEIEKENNKWNNTKIDISDISICLSLIAIVISLSSLWMKLFFKG